jgi:hypothetical protein
MQYLATIQRLVFQLMGAAGAMRQMASNPHMKYGN